MSHAKHRFFGYTIEKSVEMVPNELNVDAVGLWQIIPAGRNDFGLSGEELVDFAKRHIIALLRKGALPVRGLGKAAIWKLQKQYGSSEEEIANNIIAEWRASGVDPDVGGVWFSLPDAVE